LFHCETFLLNILKKKTNEFFLKLNILYRINHSLKEEIRYEEKKKKKKRNAFSDIRHLHLLKNNELDKLLNKENEFFKDEHFEVEKKIADKPLYLKDYQRDLLLSNNQEEKPFKTYQD